MKKIENFKAKQKTKKINNSLKWNKVKSVTDDCIEKTDGTIVKSITISARDVFGEDLKTAKTVINQLRLAYSKLTKRKLFHSFVNDKPNLSEYDNTLLLQLDKEGYDKELVIEEREKVEQFEGQFSELLFILSITGKDDKKFRKDYTSLKQQLGRAFHKCHETTKEEYQRFLAWTFENKALTDFSISNGVFEKSGELPAINIFTLDDDYQPLSVAEGEDYFKLGNKFCRTYLVTSLPIEYSCGLMMPIVKQKSVKTQMFTEVSKIDLAAMLQKEQIAIDNKKKKADIEKNDTLKEVYTKQSKSLTAFIKIVSDTNDKCLDSLITLTVTADNIEDLNDRCENFSNQLVTRGIKVAHFPDIAIGLYEQSNPLLYGNSINPNTLLGENISIPIPAYSFAMLYPYKYETLYEMDGFLFGYSHSGKGKIVLNPALYIHNPTQAKLLGRNTGNGVVLGTSGSGKTTDAALLARWGKRIGLKVIFIDPENKSAKFARRHNGKFLEFGNTDVMFNMFDLLPVTSDDDEDLASLQDDYIYNTLEAINNVIDHVKNIISLYSTEISEDGLNTIGIIAKKMYIDAGIADQINFKHLTPVDMPTLKDFHKTAISLINELEDVETVNSIKELVRKLIPMLNEHAGYFNGHTNVDLDSNRLIIIGTKKLYNKPKNLVNAVNYILSSYSFTTCLNANDDSLFLYDEIHTVIGNKNGDDKNIIGDMIGQLWRRSRKYNNFAWGFDQEPHTLIGRAEEIINNSTYRIIKELNTENALNSMNALMGITEQQKNTIAGFFQGDSLLFISNKMIIKMRTWITETEDADVPK